MADFEQSDGPSESEGGPEIDIDRLNVLFQQYRQDHPEIEWLPLLVACPARLRIESESTEDITTLPPELQSLVQGKGNKITVKSTFAEPVIFLAQTTAHERLVYRRDDKKATEQMIRLPAHLVLLPPPIEMALQQCFMRSLHEENCQLKITNKNLQNYNEFLQTRVTELLATIRKNYVVCVSAILAMTALFSYYMLSSSQTAQEKDAPKALKKEEEKKDK